VQLAACALELEVTTDDDHCGSWKPVSEV